MTYFPKQVAQGVDADGNVVDAKVNPDGTLIADRIVRATIAAIDGMVEIDGLGMGNIGMQIDGVFVGTIAFEATINGDRWFPVQALSIPPTMPVTSTTAPGQWKLTASGFPRMRARATAWTSGAADVTLAGSPTASSVRATQSVPASDGLAWPVKQTDGAGQVIGTPAHPVTAKPPPAAPYRIVALGSVQLFTGSGTLRRIVIEKAGLGASLLTLHGGLNALSPVLVGPIDTSVARGFEYGIPITGGGIFAVLAGGGAATVTVIVEPA